MPPAYTASAARIPLISSIRPFAGETAAWLLDVWGVVHNGVRPYDEACEACERFRGQGGIVVLVSNSPRPSASVAEQLARIGVPRSSFDAIVSSGDVARMMVEPYAGRPVLHIGPERDLGVFAGLDVERVGPEQAEAVVCTGLFNDEIETPDDYTQMLTVCVERGLPMICGNPDIEVVRGGHRIYCAGAIARAYEALGGKAAYAGKPFQPIYDLTFATHEGLRRGASERSRLLAIGDGIHTDIAGADAAGVRSVFIASDLHGALPFDAAAIEGFFPAAGPRPIAAMAKLAW
jgi:HAD superfamily hydrolase (TIGR01459 family)